MSRARDDAARHSENFNAKGIHGTSVYGEDGIPPCVPKPEGVLLLQFESSVYSSRGREDARAVEIPEEVSD